MQYLFERLTDLLGESPKGTAFSQFIEDLGEEPLINEAKYSFPKTGVSLVVSRDLFAAVMVHFDTPSTRSGDVLPYDGKLPKDVTRYDTRDLVLVKWGSSPIESKRVSIAARGPRNFQDTYRLSPFFLSFTFDSENQKLLLLAIGKTDSIVIAQSSTAQ